MTNPTQDDPQALAKPTQPDKTVFTSWRNHDAAGPGGHRATWTDAREAEPIVVQVTVAPQNLVFTVRAAELRNVALLMIDVATRLEAEDRARTEQAVLERARKQSEREMRGEPL